MCFSRMNYSLNCCLPRKEKDNVGIFNWKKRIFLLMNKKSENGDDKMVNYYHVEKKKMKWRR